MERADYASQDAPRARRPAARGLMGNVVLLPGEFGNPGGRAALASLSAQGCAGRFGPPAAHAFEF